MGTDVRVHVESTTIASGSFTTSPGTSVDIALPSGFGTPKGCLLYAIPAASLTSDQTDLEMSFGMSDGTNENNRELNDSHGTTAQTGHESTRNNNTIGSAFGIGSNTGRWRIDISSFGTDKVTLTCVDVGTAEAVAIVLVAFGGADCECVAGRVTLNTTVTGTASWTHNLNTTYGQGANYMVFGTGNNTPTSTQVVNKSTIGLGAAFIGGSGSTIEQGCTGWVSDDATSVDLATGIMQPTAGTPFFATFPIKTGSNYNHERADISSADGDSITVKTIAGTSGYVWDMMVVDLGDLNGKIFALDPPTSTGTWSPSVTSWTPQAVGCFTAMVVSPNTNSVAAQCDAWGMGWLSEFDSTIYQGNISLGHDNGATTSTVNRYIRDKFIFLKVNTGGTATLEFDSSSNSMTTTGFSTSLTVTTATQRYWTGWAIEAQPSAGIPSGLSLLGVGT